MFAKHDRIAANAHTGGRSVRVGVRPVSAFANSRSIGTAVGCDNAAGDTDNAARAALPVRSSFSAANARAVAGGCDSASGDGDPSPTAAITATDACANTATTGVDSAAVNIDDTAGSVTSGAADARPALYGGSGHGAPLDGDFYVVVCLAIAVSHSSTATHDTL